MDGNARPEHPFCRCILPAWNAEGGAPLPPGLDGSRGEARNRTEPAECLQRCPCSPLCWTLRRHHARSTKIDLSSQKYLVPGPATTGGLASLEGLEEVLAKRAQQLGVELRRGMPVADFTESEDGVAVQAGGESFRTRWLVGCDGGRSTVRKLAGFEFAGTDPEFTGYSAWVCILGQARSAESMAVSGGFTVIRLTVQEASSILAP
jgi:hypothetical protein